MSTVDGLRTLEVALKNRKVIVSEASYEMGEERGRIIGELLVQNGDTIPPMHSNVFISTYSALMACSSGDLPKTPDEFKRNLRDLDIEVWISEARKLNPHWFSWMGEVEEIVSESSKKANEKKKGSKRPKSQSL